MIAFKNQQRFDLFFLTKNLILFLYYLRYFFYYYFHYYLYQRMIILFQLSDSIRKFPTISQPLYIAFPFNFRFKMYLQVVFAHALLFPDSQRGLLDVTTSSC